MEASIRARALEVRRPGAYIGFLEWAAWGCLEQRRILMLLGADVWDIMEVFAPGVSIPADAPVCRVAAVRVSASGSWLSPGLPGQGLDANHFVIGSAPREPLPCAPASSKARGAGGDAQSNALRLGWLLRETVAQGDCGLDVMAYHLGLERIPLCWLELRVRIADFLDEHAADASWQEIAEACQESSTSDASRSSAWLGAKRRPHIYRLRLRA